MKICSECAKKHNVRLSLGYKNKPIEAYFGYCKYCDVVKGYEDPNVTLFYIETRTERIARKRREFRDEMKDK